MTRYRSLLGLLVLAIGAFSAESAYAQPAFCTGDPGYGTLERNITDVGGQLRLTATTRINHLFAHSGCSGQIGAKVKLIGTPGPNSCEDTQTATHSATGTPAFVTVIEDCAYPACISGIDQVLRTAGTHWWVDPDHATFVESAGSMAVSK